MSYKYFTEEELTCKCGCGQALMDEDFMSDIEEIRESLGFPFIVTSAYRCPDYNEQVSSTGRDGPHTTGKAMDIAVSYERAYRLLQAAVEAGFSGIGVKQNGNPKGRFLHLDMVRADEAPRPRVWSY